MIMKYFKTIFIFIAMILLWLFGHGDRFELFTKGVVANAFVVRVSENYYYGIRKCKLITLKPDSYPGQLYLLNPISFFPLKVGEKIEVRFSEDPSGVVSIEENSSNIAYLNNFLNVWFGSWRCKGRGRFKV